MSSICLLCANSFAQGTAISTDPMPVVADLGGGVLDANGNIITVYPATVTLEGQWCDIALWKGPFSITEYPTFRVRLQRGFEDTYVQLFARNAWASSNYAGPYIPFHKNEVLIENDFVEVDTEGNFDDDPICTWFALQKTNIGPERVTVTIMEAVLINEDGEEVVSHNVRNGSWKPAPEWQEPDPVYEADIKFTSKGTVGLYDAQVTPGTAHRFTFRTAEPMPEGFTFYWVIDDGDDTTYSDVVPAGKTEYTSPLIDDSYIRAYLEYDGECPKVFHFSQITRDIVDPAAISSIVSDFAAPTDYFTPAGVRLTEAPAGFSIERQRFSDGSVRTQKVMR